ncbi:MAG: LacI family DNA-binding transcriptional regulator [Anaerolineae bacterium]|nr:LacI family DNA-binding transcriptional regulator [Anaerolineae bacterium]
MRKNSDKITIIGVANEAGVSNSSVSYIVENKTDIKSDICDGWMNLISAKHYVAGNKAV